MNLVDSMHNSFSVSSERLGLGSYSDMIFDALVYKIDHILFVDEDFIKKKFPNGDEIYNHFINAKNDASLADVIYSMNIKGCEKEESAICAKLIVNPLSVDLSTIPNVCRWVIEAELPFDINDDSHHLYVRLKSLLRHKDNSDIGHEFDMYKI